MTKTTTAKKRFMAPTSQLSRRKTTFLLQMAQAADQERGQRLRELRGGKPQPVVADAVGVTLRAYQEWEAGGGIRWDNVKKLAECFGVDDDYILNGPREDTPDLMGALSDGDLSQLRDQLNRVEDKLDWFIKTWQPLIAHLAGEEAERLAPDLAKPPTVRPSASSPRNRAA